MPSERSGPPAHTGLGGPILVFAVAFLLGIAGAGTVSLWTDEAITISAADRSWEQLRQLLGNIDAVHGLYYGFMKLWTEVFGASPFALRLPSAVAAGGTAVGTFVLARRFTSPGTALTAGLLCAVLPRMAWASVEARPFVFSALAAVWATWAVVTALERGEWRWARYTAFAVVGVLSNIYLVFVVMAHGVTVLVLRSDIRSKLAYLRAAGTTAVLTLPVLLLVRSQQGQLGVDISRAPAYVARRVLVNQVFLGETPTDGVLPRWFDLLWQLAAVGAAVLGLVLVLVAVFRRSHPGDAKREVLAWCLPWVILPTVVVASYSVLVAPVYQPRYLTFTVPPAAILLALGARALGRSWLVVTSLALLATACAVIAVSQRLPNSKPFSDWASAVQVIERCAQPGDAVLFEPRRTTEVTTRSTRRMAVAYPDPFTGLRDLTLRRSGAESASLDGSSAALPTISEELSGVEAVWVIYGDNDPEEVVRRDAQVLVDAGLAKAGQWLGPSTTIDLYAGGDRTCAALEAVK